MRMKRTCLRLALPTLLPLCLLACGTRTLPPSTDVQSDGHNLYERVGGKEGIHAVVDALLKNLLADSRVSAFFRGDEHLPKLEEQLCELSGGPCHYRGKDMKAAHDRFGISGPQFDAFLEDFERALDAQRVSRADKDELLRPLSAMRGDVVGKPK